MRICVFDAHRFETGYFNEANRLRGHALTFLEERLNERTAVLAEGYSAVCAFVNDHMDARAIRILARGGTRLIALRSAGFNNVDRAAAAELGVKVVRVPEYSPHAVAEHAVALLLTLNRKIHRAYYRVRESNFSLDGLVGFDLHAKTAGVIGTGKIGAVMARILRGFGCRLLASDLEPDRELARETGLEYVEMDRLLREADILSLHVPLSPATEHIIDRAALAKTKPGVILINTGRGALIDTRALIEALKTGQVGAAGLDVYEEEEGVFFEDLSNQILQDDVLARLLTFPNVILTAHQGFLTKEALRNIAETTLANVTAFENGERLENEVRFR